MSTHPPPRRLDLDTAAETVALPAVALEALAAAGYVTAVEEPGSTPSFAAADLKAFVARNADDGSGPTPQSAEDNADLEPQELVDLLDERAEHMALRLLKMYSIVYPQAASWPVSRQGKFIERTKSHFEAFLAIAALGDRIQPELVEELHSIGAAAARSGSKLPQVLTMLRVSRDLVVQNAVDLAENGERPGGHALALVLTRILPAMDALGDALTAGYWEAMFPA